MTADAKQAMWDHKAAAAKAGQKNKREDTKSSLLLAAGFPRTVPVISRSRPDILGTGHIPSPPLFRKTPRTAGAAR